MKKVAVLRAKYPRFVYQKYSYCLQGGNLKTSFVFKIEPDIYFRPEITVKNVPKDRLKKIGASVINNFVFHLGLMEMPSYWKCTCSPEIVIEAGFLDLDKEQILWWKSLILKGMGQFFFENKINWLQPNFLKITAGRGRPKQRFNGGLRERYLVPVGGGKDSIVTLEKLKEQRKKINAFLANPTNAVRDVLRVAGIKNPIVVEREIDPALLKLNKKGYLNGHTPFTSVLSFISAFCAVLFDYKNIAFSNEKSANEGNVRYLGRTVNHQWAKSSEFEKMFKDYCKKYLAKNLNYFSFLRKYSELEIAEMFAKYPKYFPVFSSCNVVSAQKLNKRWCQNCPKCLFAYLILYPFLEKKEILKIFGQDLFEDKNLLPIMKGLMGQGKHKPFECVGTFKESKIAFRRCLEKAKKSGRIPYLLTK